MATMKVFKHVALGNLVELVQYSDLSGKFVGYRTYNKDAVLFSAQPVIEKRISFHFHSFVSIKNEHIQPLSQALSKLNEKKYSEQVFVIVTKAEKHA